MKIICSTNMPLVEEAFSTIGETKVIEGRKISADDVKNVDILATRSTTKINKELLDGSTVKFVGTATIGIDHIDTEYLDSHNIKWCSAPGCNANSVSEYITAGLLHLATKYNFTLENKTIGVIGIGNVGKRVVKKAQALGMKVLQNDPPRQRAENSNQFVDLDTILRKSDVVTIHTPLTKEGIDATYHLANEDFFNKMKPGAIFINAARGAIVDSPAMLKAIDNGIISHCILDTWEGEPDVKRELMKKVDIATPHIAGHSYEGKVTGTIMVFEEACKFFNIQTNWDPEPLMSAPLVPEITINATNRSDEDILNQIVQQVYDITADDEKLRKVSEYTKEEGKAYFDSLRKNYPMRREFRFTTIKGSNMTEPLHNKIAQLGFKSV